MRFSHRLSVGIGLLALGLAVGPVAAHAQCGCMDVALVIDDTGSMGGAINNVKAGLTNIIAVAQAASGNNLRLGLVTFADSIEVDQPFTTNITQITAAVNALTPAGGAGLPEASDEALNLVINGAASAGCTVTTPNGPLGGFRSGCVKVAILVTDAEPGGCDDTYADGVDDAHAALIATNAASKGVLISAVFVEGINSTSDAHPVSIQQDVMLTYATVSGGVFTNVPSSGLGTGDSIQDIVANCGGQLPKAPDPEFPVTQPAQHGDCITRDGRYWATHLDSEIANCATLLKAIEAMPDGRVAIGFMGLPQEFRNADAVKDEIDGAIEALGFYWRSPARTGEDSGTQNQKNRGARLCRDRKRLTAELIATLANNALLGTVPVSCSGAVVFPADLIEQAGAANAGGDRDAIRAMTLLLKKFNRSGLTNDFSAVGLVECSPFDKKITKSVSRDPTTIISCPGLNDFCENAEALVHFPFKTSVNLTRYSDQIVSSTCAGGGRDAVWKIEPPIAAAGRSFIVETAGSNFDTVLTVRAGTCESSTEVACNDDVDFTPQSRVVFIANGTDTYYLVAEGKNGAYGKLKLKVTSY